MAEFKIPNIAEGISEVDLAALTVSVGDIIEPGMVVAEVETEKAATDIDCPIGGKVVKIHANPGDTMAVGAVLLTIEASAAAEAAPAKEAPAAPAAAEPAPAASSPPEAAPAPVAAPVAASPAAAASVAPTDDRAPAPAGPATRRLARQLGVDLHGVVGSAAGGRITQEDVKTHVKQIMEGGGVASGGGGGYAPPPLPDFTKWGPAEREPMNKISRSAAANLSMCWNVIPHVTQHDLIDITDLEAARRRYSEKAKKTGAPKVTMTAIAMKASVVCLKEFPKFNSSLDPQTNELVYRKYFNIGCAVDTPNGLLVPVIKDCDQKSVAEIGNELTDVAGRARDRKVTMDEMQGACFTITNLGGIGGTAFTPIVNYPEVAILGMSRGRKELQIVDGEIEERFMLPLSMSYDHRVINGADAARFVVRLGQLLTDAFNLAATI
ncbi:MAG: pyruvate dehydrogenase E2 component (dihydrolipoamide acetyltransferase) [Porticoccaceae bacterium]|jgi:pyruvate dehydrogenase E2 component (dihydrolipoamide acetyltransferase)